MLGYIRSIWKFVFLSLFLFLASVLCGYVLGEQLNIKLLEILSEIEPILVEVVEWKNPFWMVAFIFLNNSVKCFLAIVLGALFGIFPILFITVNGFLIGLVIFEVGSMRGLPFALTTILPHGIVEIPMVLLSSAIGLHIGNEMLKKMRGEGEIRMEIGKGVRFFAKRILPFLFLAAVIEASITPMLIQLIF